MTLHGPRQPWRAHMRAGLQPILVAGHHAFPLREAGGDDRHAVGAFADMQRAHLDGRIAFDYVSEGAGGPELHGAIRDGERVALRAHQHARINVLPGPQRIVRIVEGRLEPHAPGRLIDLIVDEAQSALIEHRAALAGDGGDLDGSAGERPLHGGQLLFRQREDDADGLYLGDHHDAGGRRGMHDVARIDQADAGAAVDRRHDSRVVELRARIVDDSLVDFDLGGDLLDQRVLRVDRLLAG